MRKTSFGNGNYSIRTRAFAWLMALAMLLGHGN